MFCFDCLLACVAAAADGSLQPYDGRTSDLWSIGVVLYALVCGQLPYQEGDMKRLLMQINSPLMFPSRLSFGKLVSLLSSPRTNTTLPVTG